MAASYASVARKEPVPFPEALFQVNIKRERNEKIDFKLFKQALKGVEGIFGISTSPNFIHLVFYTKEQKNSFEEKKTFKIGTKEYNIEDTQVQQPKIKMVRLTIFNFGVYKTLDQAIEFIAKKLKFRGIIYQIRFDTYFQTEWRNGNISMVIKEEEVEHFNPENFENFKRKLKLNRSKEFSMLESKVTPMFDLKDWGKVNGENQDNHPPNNGNLNENQSASDENNQNEKAEKEKKVNQINQDENNMEIMEEGVDATMEEAKTLEGVMIPEDENSKKRKAEALKNQIQIQKDKKELEKKRKEQMELEKKTKGNGKKTEGIGKKTRNEKSSRS